MSTDESSDGWYLHMELDFYSNLLVYVHPYEVLYSDIRGIYSESTGIYAYFFAAIWGVFGEIWTTFGRFLPGNG